MKTIFKTKVGEVACYNNDHYFFNSFKTNNPYELKMINDFLKSFIVNAGTILDIGSHIGYHSLAYSQLNPSAKIYAFEPQSKVYELLNENLERNGIKNVQASNVALSNKSGYFTLSETISDGNTPNQPIEYGTSKEFNLGGVSLGEGGEVVKTMTIDELKLEGVEFIKIDVEGAEPLVIAGGEETIKKYRPAICFEENQKTITKEMRKIFGYEDTRTTIELLKSYGYTTFVKIVNDNIIALSE